MGGQEIHQGDDVRVQWSPHKFPLSLQGCLLEAQVFGHSLDQRKVDHKAILSAELAVAGLLRIVEHFEIARPGIEDAEPDRVRSQYSFGLLQRRKGAKIHRHQHFRINGVKKLHDRLSVWHILPLDRAILFFPHELI